MGFWKSLGENWGFFDKYEEMWNILWHKTVTRM
jgi:hypothetical protein